MERSCKAELVECKHTDLEFLGSEKTDTGQNRYMRCRSCGELIVVTPENRVFGVKPIRESPDAQDRTHSE